MIETLVGGIFGGAFRLAPEVMKYFDRKNERRHELAMLDKNIEADKLRAQQRLDEIRESGKITVALEDARALVEGVKAQAQLTGVRWVDAINSLVRPTITFWWVIVLSTAVLIAKYVLLLQSGVPPVNAIAALWGPEEKAIVASIMAFWFVDRSLRHSR